MAGREEYSPVDRRSLSADETARSLLSSDEKDYNFEPKRPAKRRHNLALKSLLLVCVLVLHAGLVVLLARWLGVAFPWGSGGGGGAAGPAHSQPKEPKYGFEGVIPAVYKDPTAEFMQVNPCGHSAEEARARGCRYGMLYGAWLPEECYDEETEERFKHYTNWRFWLQPNRTQEVSWDEVARGEFEYVLVEWEYHQRHCAEMNRRIFTAMTRRGLHSIDSYLSQWDHTDHCAHSAMEVHPMHELMAILWRKFPDCGVVRWNY